jgi:hypothetical protein
MHGWTLVVVGSTWKQAHDRRDEASQCDVSACTE